MPSDPAPRPHEVLETARLLLRPMRPADVDALHGVFADPAVMAAFARPPFDRAETEGWVARNLAHQERHGFGLRTVVLRADGRVIGDCGLERVELGGAPVVELGYDLRRDHWGYGYATEAAAAVRDDALGRLGVGRLVSLVRVGNTRSARVAERIGMRRAGQLERGGVRYAVYELDRATDHPSASATR